MKIRKKEKKKGQKRERESEWWKKDVSHLSLVTRNDDDNDNTFLNSDDACVTFGLEAGTFMRELLFWSQDTWRPEPRPN